MARTCKPSNLSTAKIGKENIEKRKKEEEKLRGSSDKIKPPKYLNKNQKTIFNFIVKELEAGGILGNLDVYILSSASIALDRLQYIEELINVDITNITNKELLSAKRQYANDFAMAIKELNLSPTQRAKLGMLKSQQQEEKEDPVMKALRGDA